MDTLSSIERSFLEWFSEAAPRFAVPIRTKESNDHSLDFEFVGNPALTATLTSAEINVSVNWKGECWDFLLCLDVQPRRAENGYICDHCEADGRMTFPSLEALWRDHLFEPFLRWINEKLASSKAIGLYGSPSSGWTHAKLLSDRHAERTEPDLRIPLEVELREIQ